VADTWSAGAGYEPYVGRWSRGVAKEFLAWLAPAPAARWLDVGCGTGALTETILATADPAAVVGVDPSAGFLQYAAEHVLDERASFRAGDALALPAPDATFDVVVSALMLNFVPDRVAALREMQRVTRPGGDVAAYVWDYPGEMQLVRRFWDAATQRHPAVRSLDEGVRFGFCRPEPLRAVFTRAGLDGVEVDSVVVPTVFAGFDDYWTPFLGGQGPAPSYLLSLDEPERAAIRETLRAGLPAGTDGTIRLTARAWVVRGTRPG
jgi:SAM-dependent methyltransferase